MTSGELINYLIPPLKQGDTIYKAKNWMEEFRISQLPVVENGKFLGFLTEDSIYQIDNWSLQVKDCEFELPHVFIVEGQHYFDLLRVAYAHEIKMVAVLDKDENYLGVVTIDEVIKTFADSSFINESGAILVLSMNVKDYSLSEISRITEQNDTKILSSHLSNDNIDLDLVKLTLKVDKQDVLHLKNQLISNGYTLEESYNDIQDFGRDSERLDVLMKYLEI